MTSGARHTDDVTCALLFWITHSLKCHEDITADPQTGPQARTAAVRAISQVAPPAPVEPWLVWHCHQEAPSHEHPAQLLLAC